MRISDWSSDVCSSDLHLSRNRNAPHKARVMNETQMFEARQVLLRIFGHADFRGLQAGVVAEVLAGRNALAVLPTGGGKSLCYQIPGIIRPGVGIEIGRAHV